MQPLDNNKLSLILRASTTSLPIKSQPEDLKRNYQAAVDQFSEFKQIYENKKVMASVKIKEMIDEILELNGAVLDRFMVHQTSNMLNNKYDSTNFTKIV